MDDSSAGPGDAAAQDAAESHSQSPSRYIRSRIANACDGCKARKVKCDGKLPCGYCAGRQRPHACHYSPQRRRRPQARLPRSAQHHPEAAPAPGTRGSGRTRSGGGDDSSGGVATATTPGSGSGARAGTRSRGAGGNAQTQAVEPSAADDDTEVPREARLLCDAHGKLIFIGDCAPLSFFQSVRQLVTSRVAQNAFAPESSRYSVLENAPAGALNRERGQQQHQQHHQHGGPPPVRLGDIAGAVAAYLRATTGLVDLFDNSRLVDDLVLWADLEEDHQHQHHQHHEAGGDVTSVVNYLVLAIGRLTDDEALARAYFEHARDRAYATLSGSLSVGTVQAFALITVYLLCSCQINGAFLLFGVAVRAAYALGVHRSEVNARFGPEAHRRRDRLWKSLRVVDLFLSTSMGRPPATSDVDCTVAYRGAVGADGGEALDLLNASAQILLITEGVVVEIYSRRKISLQLTEGISLQLRDWSVRWLQQLKDVMARGAPPPPVGAPGKADDGDDDAAQVVGACQVLSSYYYAVMLVSRPFLMYEMCRRLADGPASRSTLTSGKSKLADACIDAASLMVDPILDLIDRGVLNGRVPLLVSWLFASSLVLGLGLLGGFGRILEKYSRMSIQALDHFAKTDGHAAQYSLIAQSLLTTALEHLERRELQERLRRTENSSQLFGLMPSEARSLAGSPRDLSSSSMHARSPGTPSAAGSNGNAGIGSRAREPHLLDRSSSYLQHHGLQGGGMPSPGVRLGDIDSAFLGLTESLLQTPDASYWGGSLGNDGDAGSALNLFPLLEAGGGIDLAHYL